MVLKSLKNTVGYSITLTKQLKKFSEKNILSRFRGKLKVKIWGDSRGKAIVNDKTTGDNQDY